MKRTADQKFSMVIVETENFDDSVIYSLMSKYPALALARISKSKFGITDLPSCLQFYVHHRLFDNKDAVIKEIKSRFEGHKIMVKVSE